jgi:L-aspartate oxidase
MRRFAFNGDIQNLKKESFDVVIIGSGIAGLYTALSTHPSKKIVVLSKESSIVCSSFFAQGGIAAVTNSDDDNKFHIKDTLTAGAGLCDRKAVETLVEEGPAEINRLISMGVSFDVKEDGTLETTREGGHSMNRILHSGGDATGKELTNKLVFLASQKENIELRTDIFVSDILTKDNKAVGIIFHDGEFKVIWSSNIVVCTGGIGQVYKYTTNPIVSTGDGVATSARAGAVMQDMEFVQFHPTAFADIDKNGQCFLISEAVRGEGGYLRNNKGERFMVGKHELAELAPRDIVARAIFEEIKRTHSNTVFIDITHKSKSFLKKRFPTIYDECKNRGIDISKDFIPVVPVQHYMMGGIKTDLNGMTNIDGLYACGESACTGVHGANRLASNSLLECIVFGRRCALHMMEKKRENKNIDFSIKPLVLKQAYSDFSLLKSEIKEIMSENGGIVRNEEDLKSGISQLNGMIKSLEEQEFCHIEQIEVYNMAITARLILEEAFERKESVGAHYLEIRN